MSQTIELYEITGVISNIKIGSQNIFNINSFASQRDFRVICPFFCPARRGDVINGYCLQQDNGIHEFVREPIVEPSSSREAVQTSFLIAMRRTGFNKYLSDKLYDFFKSEAIKRIDEKRHTDDPVARNRDILSSAILEMISVYAQKFQFDETTIEPLVEIGLTEEQASKLLRWWYQSFSLRRLYLLGLTKREIQESCDRGWTCDTLYYQLLENPFILERVDFQKAYSIVRRYNLSFGPNMIECAQLVRFIDEETIKRGWACYPLPGLIRKFPRYNELESMLKMNYKCSIRYNFIYLKHQAETEDLLTDFLTPQKLPETYCSDSTKSKLVDEQINAVETALNNRVSVITGLAGSGKTTVISALADELELRHGEYLVASFTGKAVARIQELIHGNDIVKTLHMILHGAVSPKVKTLIVDEVSMVPSELLARVLNKLMKEDFRIVLVGDPNQVQPIEWGDLFNQIFLSSTIPTVHLTIDHRRTSKGILYQNVLQIATEIPQEICFQWGSDCHMIPGGVPELESLIKLIHSQGIPHDQITIVSPYRELDEINQKCQEIFLDKMSPSITDSFGNIWKVGARVMMTSNRYDIGIMNGMEGIVTDVFRDHIDVDFKNGQKVKIPTFVTVVNDNKEEYNDDMKTPLSTKLLVLSWAITIHKSQGSEWRIVIFYLRDKFQGSFINRKLVYTGISRAKEILFVIAREENFFLSTLQIEPPMRYDNLSKRLQQIEYTDGLIDPMHEQRIRDMSL